MYNLILRAISHWQKIQSDTDDGEWELLRRSFWGLVQNSKSNFAPQHDKVITLQVLRTNISARNLYRRLGFKTVGENKHIIR